MTPAPKSRLVPRASLSDAVYERLRDDIMHGELPDGSTLNQVALAERYGVSRIPIREALRRLQAESLVIATPYHPFVIRKVTAAQVLELVDIRAALEDLAVSKREQLSADEIGELRQINQAMSKDHLDPIDFLLLDRKLHRVIAGPRTMTVDIIDDVRDKVHKYLNSMVSGRPGRTTATQEHARIIDALEKPDMAMARRLIHEHVMQSRDFIAGRLDAEATK